MSAGEYLSTRVSSLKSYPLTRPPNPIDLLQSLNRRHWAFFFVAFAAWTWDAFDFFTVSLTVTDLAEDFGHSKTDITWGITLVLMFRSVGSVIFGIASDRYGRKWPFIVNNVLFIILELVRPCVFAVASPVTSMVREAFSAPHWNKHFGAAAKTAWRLSPPPPHSPSNP